MDTNRELRRIARERPQLSRGEIAKLTRSRNTSTVDRWFAPKTRRGQPNPTYRRMPDSKLELLKVRLLFNGSAEPETKEAGKN